MRATFTVPRSRRALLGAAVASVAGAVATVLERPGLVDASSNGATIAIGGSYPDAQYETYIKNTSQVNGSNPYNRALELESVVGSALFAHGPIGIDATGDSWAISAWGQTATGPGIYAVQGTVAPRLAMEPAGVLGVTYQTAGGSGLRGLAYGDSAGTYGVYGQSDSASTAYGVYGLASAATTNTQGVGVYGHARSSVHGVGTYGYAESATGTTYGAFGHAVSAGGFGVHGLAVGGGTGVAGASGRATALPVVPNTGVYGEAMNGTTAHGVWGRSASGRGVAGSATSGIGVYAVATTGYAIAASGRVHFGKVSGLATIAAGASSVTVTPGVAITTTTFALLTARSNLGARALWHTVDPTAGTLTVHVSSAVSATTSIGWLLLS